MRRKKPDERSFVFTIYINESNSYCNYEATDENGNQVSGDLLDDLMDDFWDSYSEAQPF